MLSRPKNKLRCLFAGGKNGAHESVALARLLADDAGKTVSHEFVASHLWQAFERYDIQKLAFDRWNFKHLLPWLLRAGFSEQFVKDHFVEFGQGGTHSASSAVA
jgi:hypothetical protein